MAGTNKQTDKLVNVIVCVGAAVVIFGAWAENPAQIIADVMLTVGLLTEAVIFLVYAFLPPPGRKWLRWQKHFLNWDQLVIRPWLLWIKCFRKQKSILLTLSVLSDNFSKLGTTVEKMTDVADISHATGDYTQKTKEATSALSTMKDAYQNATTTIGHFNNAADSTSQFHEQVQVLTKNLGSLNTIYELELQDTNNHLKAMNGFYSNLVNASQAMQGSADDAKKTQEQIALLAKNLSNLNNVYGNMLAAMQGRS